MIRLRLRFAGQVLASLAGLTLVAEAQMRMKAPMDSKTSAPTKAISQQRVHTYYIAADEVQWNYLPPPRCSSTAETMILHAYR